MSTEDIKASPEAEFEEIQTAIHDRIAQAFALHGKVYNRNLDRWRTAEFEKPLSLSIAFEADYSWSRPTNKFNTILKLSTAGWGSSVDEFGRIKNFRNRTRKIKLTNHLEDIFEAIDIFIGRFPAYLANMKQAEAVIAERKQSQNNADAKRRADVTELSRLTGYGTGYGGIKLPEGSPYQKLEINSYSDRASVLVTVEIPMEQFDQFHRAYASARQVWGINK